MLLELILVLGGSLLILLPGIFLAHWLQVGNTIWERLGFGSSLGLAAAVYLASLISHFNLRWFYPLWFAVFLVSVFGWVRSRRRVGTATVESDPRNAWLLALLLVVGISRYAIALPQFLPRGWDPTFHSVLARKIQLSQHAIHDWQPFESVALNYPTGSHTLLAILSGITGLPVHILFKDLIPLLGVLSTLQVYIFVRRLIPHPEVPLYSAGAYGLWAMGGSIDYYSWGGLPNELAMLLFIAMLSIWLENRRPLLSICLMGLLYAAVVLVHHHVMMVSGMILICCLIFEIFRKRAVSWKPLLAALVLAGLLASFFLVPYALRAAQLSSTYVFSEGEGPQRLSSLPNVMGTVFSIGVVAIIPVWLIQRRPAIHPLVLCAVIPLLLAYIAGEYIWPAILARRGQPPSTAFTPSRFISDMTYFLAVLPGLLLVQAQRIFQLPRAIIALILILCAGLEYNRWKDMTEPDYVTDAYITGGDLRAFVTACQWIEHNTSPDSIVLNKESWVAYFTWRPFAGNILPVSEPRALVQPHTEAIDAIIDGRLAPDSPREQIIVIADWRHFDFANDLWRDATGLHIVKFWPHH